MHRIIVMCLFVVVATCAVTEVGDQRKNGEKNNEEPVTLELGMKTHNDIQIARIIDDLSYHRAIAVGRGCPANKVWFIDRCVTCAVYLDHRDPPCPVTQSA